MGSIDKVTAKGEARRARSLREQGQHQEAIEVYDRLLSEYPIYAFYFERGSTYSAIGLTDEAIEDFTSAIELLPDDADFYVNRGNQFARKRAFDEALRDFNKALELAPDNHLALNSRGYVFCEIGQHFET
jgi:tetratricopeptide (TPR) repeat protein